MTSNNLSYKGFKGSIEVSLEDMCLHGRVLFIDDIVTYEASTIESIRNEFEAAVDRYLAYCERTGKDADKPYSGSFNVRLGATLHRNAAIAAKRQGMKLNELVVKAVNLFLEKPAHAVVVNHNHFTITTSSAPKTALASASQSSGVSWRTSNELH